MQRIFHKSDTFKFVFLSEFYELAFNVGKLDKWVKHKPVPFSYIILCTDLCMYVHTRVSLLQYFV